jgi:hypothetical protein
MMKGCAAVVLKLGLIMIIEVGNGEEETTIRNISTVVNNTISPYPTAEITKSYVKTVGLRNPPGIHEVTKKQ